eukprot:EG_transcript_4517
MDAVDYYYSMRMITDQPRCCQLERVACLSVIMFQELRRIPPVNAVCANGVCYSVSFGICHPTNKTPQQWPVFKQGSWCFFIKPPPQSVSERAFHPVWASPSSQEWLGAVQAGDASAAQRGASPPDEPARGARGADVAAGPPRRQNRLTPPPILCPST